MKEIFQPENGYVIPADGIEVLNEGKTMAVRFDIAKAAPVETEDGMKMEGQYESEFVRLNRADWNYAGVVNAIVRDKYSESQVEAIILNGTDTEEHAAELTALQNWRKKAKEVAKKVIA